MKIAEAAGRTGLSAHTIRYYEKAGMLPEIARDAGGHRQFSIDNLAWLELLASLRDTGMSMKNMKLFARLYRQGDASVAQRKRMLLDHDRQLKIRQTTIQKCRELLALKITRYDSILELDP